MKITADATITVTQPCATCGGKGRTDDVRLWCRRCGASIGRDWFSGGGLDRKDLPCGHAGYERDWPSGRVVDNISESDSCPDCEGTGRFVLTVTLRELAAMLLAAQEGVIR